MKTILKWTAILISALIVVMLVTGVILYQTGMKKLTRTYPDVKVEQVNISTDTEALTRGKHISVIWACTRCHGDDLAGSLITSDPIEGYVPLLGTIPVSNLTSGRGGIGKSYTDADWVRAIRHGVKPNGQVELFMYDYSTMSDRDLGDLIAYLKQLPPVDSDQPPASYGPILPITPAVGLFTPVAELIDHDAARPEEPVSGVSKEYGKYLSALCASCHDGGPVGPVRGNYKKEDFVRAIRTGVLPNGTNVGRAMPPGIYGELTDAELEALWLYLQDQTSTQAQ